MGRTRTSIEELEFYRSPKLGSALAREEASPSPRLEKREEMEALFADLKDRRREALADVRKNGTIVKVEKFNAKGALIWVQVINPNLKIAQQCEKQMATLARLLSMMPASKNPQSVDELLKRADAIMEN